MKTKLKLIIATMYLFCYTTTFAQPRGERNQERREDIEAQKVAFITQKLNLTPEEAQKFWPVYNQYQDKIQELRKKRRQEGKTAKENFDALSDKELEQLIDNDLAMKQKELD